MSSCRHFPSRSLSRSLHSIDAALGVGNLTEGCILNRKQSAPVMCIDGHGTHFSPTLIVADQLARQDSPRTLFVPGETGHSPRYL